MALKWIEGFDYITTALLGSGMYQEVNDTARVTVTASAVRNGLNGLRVQATSGGSAGNGWTRKNIGGTETTIVTGFAFRPIQNDTGVIQLVGLYEGTTLHADLRMSIGTGSYDLVATRAGTTLGTASAALVDGAWHYIEIKVFLHDTTGTFEVRVNGVVALNLTAQDTRNAGTPFCDRVLLGNAAGSSASHDVYFDDWYVLDTSGSLNTDFLGDSRVAALYPTGAGNSTQWTPNAGSNWDRVDDTAADSDTTYNSEATVGEKDTYALADTPTTATTVAGVKEIVFARKDDAGAITLRQVIRAGGTDYEGGDFALGDTYTYKAELRETNPNTAVAWTDADVDGIEAGYKLQA